eukprot:7527056-Ditylum_brightwellii.AAC.1
MATEHPQLYAIILDEGYAGLEQVTRSIIPKKKPRNGQLDHNNVERNMHIGHDRVPVDFFGKGLQAMQGDGAKVSLGQRKV